MLAAITQDLAERHPGLIETEPEWFFSNDQTDFLYHSL